MSALSRLISALLILLGATASHGEAQDLRARLVGLWLIEAPHYDAFVDTGFDVPAFPVLAIRTDGTFNLFRLRPICEPVDGGEKPQEYLDHPIKRAEACRDYIAATKPDGVAAHSNPAAAGRWQIAADGRLVFTATSKVEPGKFGAERIADMGKAMAAGELDYKDRARTGEDKASLSRRMAAQARRIASFIGTYYVFDGASVGVVIQGDRLIFAGADPADRLVYRRVAPGAVAAAANIAHVLEIAATDYFRCTVEKLREGWTDRGPPPGELGSLAALANEFFPLSWALEHADALDKAGRKADAERVYTVQDRTAFVALVAKIRAHPGAAAAKDGKFGAWLGCPERDRR